MEASLADTIEGTIRPGSVIEVNEDEVIVDLGDSARGRIPRPDFKERTSETPVIEVGDAFDVYVDHRTKEENVFVASRDKARRMSALVRIREAFESQTPIQGQVLSKVGGGFSVNIGLRGFVPASQVSLRPITNDSDVIGQTLEFKIIRFEEKRMNIVLSARNLLEKQRKVALGNLNDGDVVEGTITHFADFGAFVDLNGVEGLLHNDDISWGRVRHPSEVLEVGEPVTVKIIKIDKKRRRISLGLRQIQQDPWLTADQQFPLGKEVSGQVISKTDYGCFIELSDGIEGLVHSSGPVISDQVKERVRKIEIGARIKANVLDVDLTKRRISLGLIIDDD